MPVDEPRIPADMIGMQMRQQNQIDFIGIHAGGHEPFEVWRMQLMKHRQSGAILVVARRGVDEYRAAVQTYHPCVDAQDDMRFACVQMRWNQPVAMTVECMAVEGREESFRREHGQQL